MLELHLFVGVKRQRQPLGVVENLLLAGISDREVDVARPIEGHGDHRLVEIAGVDGRLLRPRFFHENGKVVDVDDVSVHSRSIILNCSAGFDPDKNRGWKPDMQKARLPIP